MINYQLSMFNARLSKLKVQYSIILGILASFFFAFTFVLNKQMNISGGSWIWSSSLRYIFMFVILFVIMIIRNQLLDVIKEIMEKPIKWITWSTIGFGLFYAPLCFAAEYGPSWLVAGTWQITIIAGALMSPLFYRTIESNNGIYKIRNKIPRKFILISLIILSGIYLMISEGTSGIYDSKIFLEIIPVMVAAFSYPLGNRKMIEVCENRLDTFQRVFGMTLCSIPFWIILSVYGTFTVGLPSSGQVVQSFTVAIFSGIIATILFFKATDIVSYDTYKLALVESTQACEVIFTLLGGIFIFHDNPPTMIGFIGIILVVIGMIINCFIDK